MMPDEDGLRWLARWVEERHRQPVRATVESMNGARRVTRRHSAQ
jgi:hypothetical protein